MKHNSLQRLFNNTGTSLVEIMVVVGIMSVTMGAFATMMQYMNTQLKNSRIKSDALSLQLSVQTTLKDQFSCTRTMFLSGVQLPATASVSHIGLYDPSNPSAPSTSIVPNGGLSVLGNANLNVASMTLTAPSNAAAPPFLMAGATNVWAADLVIVLAPGSGPPLKPLIISGIQIQTDAGGNVQTCKMGLSVLCLTGYSDTSANGATLSSDPGFYGVFSDVFAPFTSAGNFGVNCKPGWKMTGCSASGLKPITSILTLTPIANGCRAEMVAATAASRVYVTCCSQ